MHPNIALPFEEPNFKHIQIPCELRKGFTFIVCLDEDELAFIRKFEIQQAFSTTATQPIDFAANLAEKGLITVTTGCTNTYYGLTQVGRKLISTIRKLHANH